MTTDVNDEHVTYQPNEEPDTVPHNPGAAAAKAPEKWVMPEPVFRKTSGILPQGFAEQYAHLAALEADTDEPVSDAVAEAGGNPAATVPAAVKVEAQPDISELVAEEPAEETAAAAPKKKSTAVRIVMALLGLAAVVLFIAVFLAVVYFLFLAPPDGGSPF